MRNNNNRNRSYQKPSFDLNKFDKTWITSEFEADTIKFAEEFGGYLVENRLTTSQIRNIYGEVKRIEAKRLEKTNSLKDLLLLKPKIAYAAKRAGTRGIEDFKKIMDQMLDAVIYTKAESRDNAFDNFIDLFEAILAYHKAKGGRES